MLADTFWTTFFLAKFVRTELGVVDSKKIANTQKQVKRTWLGVNRSDSIKQSVKTTLNISTKQTEINSWCEIKKVQTAAIQKKLLQFKQNFEPTTQNNQNTQVGK